MQPSKPKYSQRVIRIADIVAHPDQPRKHFDERSIQTLANSLSDPEIGLLHPIVVRPLPGKRFELLSGERRWRAARLLGWSLIEARVIDANNRAALLILAEANLDVAKLTPLEQAWAFKRLTDPIEDGGAGMKVYEVADRIRRDPSYVSSHISLTRLPDPWRTQLLTGKLPWTKPRILVRYLDRPDILKEIDRKQRLLPSEWETREQWKTGCEKIAADVDATAKKKGPRPRAELSLSSPAIAILDRLDCESPKTLTNVELVAIGNIENNGVPMSGTTVKKYVTELLQAGLIHRPHGQKGGVAITKAGVAVLEKAKMGPE